MKNDGGFLKIIHDFKYDIDDSFEDKLRVVKNTIGVLKEKGYDGIVNNVSIRGDYLDDDQEWELMREKAEICKKLGMRLWIYDEHGYPSGTAQKHTLEEVPDCEARAVVMVAKTLNAGQSEYFKIPYGHNSAVSALGYYFDGAKITEQELLNTPVISEYTKKGFYFENNSSKKLLCLCFFEKFVFEGAHCHHNCWSKRRYIDIGCKTAGDTFIKNTYKKYCDVLKDYIADGTVEAFFTDEPSYMGVYINPFLEPDSVDHKTDENITLYPLVNWSKNFENKFYSRFGYNIADNMTALFMGNNEKFGCVRQDFYTLLTELAEEAYFNNLGEFCKENNIAFSGHLLLEDKIRFHIPFEGNFFKYLSKMHIPGMDMLHSVPEKVWEDAFTPIFIKSISDLYSDGAVMDEVSAHAQGGKANGEEIFVSLLIQYCLGANIFTSYYNDFISYLGENVSAENENDFPFIEKVKQVISKLDKRKSPDIVIHYPIETMMKNNKPEIEDTPEQENKCFEKINSCESSVYKYMYAALDMQLSVRFADTDSIDLLLENPPKFFILPEFDEDEILLEKLNKLSNSGCKIIKVKEVDELVFELKKSGLVKTEGQTSGIASLWSDDKLLLVNTDKECKKLSLNEEVKAITDCKTNNSVSFIATPHKAEFTIESYGAYIIDLVNNISI